MIFVKPEALRAIRSILAGEGSLGPVRVELKFAGCCDPSLGLGLDVRRDSDLVEEIEGITFSIDPRVYEQVGEVTVAHVDRPGQSGFVLTSTKPVSEWEGFGVTQMRV